MLPSKLIAIAYYLDNGTMEGFERIAEIFAKRQRLEFDHDLLYNEVVGWKRGIKKLLSEKGYVEWNCAEMRSYLQRCKLKPPCSDECPYRIAKREQWKVSVKKYVVEETKYDVLKRVKEILDYFIVGEDKNKILLWLLVIGHQNVFLKGSTSSGKSTMVEAVLSLFPGFPKKETFVMTISGSTPKALRWVERDVIPIIYLKEAPKEILKSGIAQEGLALDLKLLMSDKMIVIWYPVKEKGAKRHKAVKKVLRTLSVVQTTTEIQLPEDFENRGWVLPTDESPEQTRRVMERKAELWMNPDIEPPDLRDIRRISGVLFYTKIKVLNPMAKYVQSVLPSEKPRMRRDIEKLLHLIATITKVRLANRMYMDNEKNRLVLISTPDDVLYAFDLIKSVLPDMIVGIDERLVRAYQAFRDVEDREGYVKSSTLAREMGISQPTARRYLQALLNAGLIEETESEGRAKRYVSRIEDLLGSIEIDRDELVREYTEWFEKYKDRFTQVNPDEAWKVFIGGGGEETTR